MGKAFFDHVSDINEPGDTLEEVVRTGARFSYPGSEDIDADQTDIFIGGWLGNGRGELFKLSIKFNDIKLEYATTLKSLKLAELDPNGDWYRVAIGSGKAYVTNTRLKEMKPEHSLVERKGIMCQLMTLSATKDPTTGGYVTVGHLQRGLPALDCEVLSTRESLIEHFEIVHRLNLRSIFLVYEKNSLNEPDFETWLGLIGDLNKEYYVVRSIILKVKNSDYFLRSIELSPNLRNDLRVVGKKIERTSELTTLLRDHNFLEYTHAEKSLYVGDWSRPFLQKVEQEDNVNEKSLLPEE